MTSRLGRAMHPADKARLRRLIRGRQEHLGRLSVIVPVFNVEPYLADCLGSIVSQSYPYLEIIVIDDGSTDGSRAVLEEFARRDRRVHVLGVPHGGNGRARNAGLERATGEFVTFADSDDIVAPNAYRAMITTLHETSSQFVVGSSDRLLGRKRSGVRMMDRLHAVARHSTRLDDYPDILSDVFLWNKMFRKDFWDTAVGAIPEDVLYEDQETTARAYTRAAAFDIIQDTVYHWRIRQDGSSITQNKHSVRDLKDRLGVVDSVSSLLIAEAGSDALLAWFTRVLGSDLVPYYEQVPSADPDYWKTLHAGLAGILSSVQGLGSELSAAVLKNIGPHEQVLCSLAAQGARGDLEDVLSYRAANGTGFEAQIRDDSFFARLEYLNALTTSQSHELLEIMPAALTPASHVRSEGWSNDGALMFSGHVYLRGLDSDAYPGDISVLVKDSTGEFREVEVSRVQDPQLDMLGNDPYASHAAAGFTCRVGTDHLGDGPQGTVEVVVNLAVAQEVVERRHIVGLAPRRTKHDIAGTAPRQPVVTDITFDAEREEFSVCVRVPRPMVPGLVDFSVALSTARNTVHPAAAAAHLQDGRKFTFSLKQNVWGRQSAAPLSGAYTLRYSLGAGPVDQLSKPVVTEGRWSFDPPLEHEFPHATVSAFQAPSGAFALRIMPPLKPGERGAYNQRRLREEYARTTGSHALTDAVLFESFAGKSCTDSPRALSDALHARSPSVPIYWAIADFSVAYPDYAVPVLRGSSEWYIRLKGSRTVVNNNTFPAYFRKSEGQRYVQTWHGTPLKKLARHAPTRYLSASYRRLMEREALMWDVMLAQNGFASEVLPAAFGYGGDVLTLGYPRNDALAAPDRESRAAQIRRDLGIAPEKIVVLYAPTWRDNAKDGSERHTLVTHLEFDRAGKSLGSEYMFLIRGHHNVAGGSSTLVGPNLIDVSMYPEINDLILASDLLVTDYSSISFDYCVTDKPIYFLVPDLSQYRDEIRGFYLDWEASAPGPMC
ncbi:CDP-glycerol glycerophosphotransferase family protein, partial [Arthrobacter sp.]|uniref:bifunctional glycosyltransferase/CDP-glycerol:glycerophosphate glycerophosphotransferase n=1 Tax=Arthrobacter sp. TaxID=1667 RepID=UPI0033999B2A